MEEWWKWAAANSNSHEECSWYEWHNTLVQSIPPLTQEEHATCIVRHVLNHEWTLMDTNDKSRGVTTKYTKYMKTRGVGMF